MVKRPIFVLRKAESEMIANESTRRGKNVWSRIGIRVEGRRKEQETIVLEKFDQRAEGKKSEESRNAHGREGSSYAGEGGGRKGFARSKETLQKTKIAGKGFFRGGKGFIEKGRGGGRGGGNGPAFN